MANAAAFGALIGGVTAGAGKAFSLWRAGMIGGTKIAQNAARGGWYEALVRSEFGLPGKGTIGSLTKTALRRHPDFGLLADAKWVRNLRATNQVQDFILNAARQNTKFTFYAGKFTNYDDVLTWAARRGLQNNVEFVEYGRVLGGIFF